MVATFLAFSPLPSACETGLHFPCRGFGLSGGGWGCAACYDREEADREQQREQGCAGEYLARGRVDPRPAASGDSCEAPRGGRWRSPTSGRGISLNACYSGTTTESEFELA